MQETAQMLIVALVLGFWGVLIWKVLKNKFVPVKSVKAVVKDKQKIESFTKYRGTGRAERYCVVFDAQGKGCLSMCPSFPMSVIASMILVSSDI